MDEDDDFGTDVVPSSADGVSCCFGGVGSAEGEAGGGTGVEAFLTGLRKRKADTIKSSVNKRTAPMTSNTGVFDLGSSDLGPSDRSSSNCDSSENAGSWDAGASAGNGI